MRRERSNGWKTVLLLACAVAIATATNCCSGAVVAASICDDKVERTDAVIALRRGIEKQGRDDVDGSIAGFERALKLQPRPAEAHMMLGVSYYLRKDYARSIAEYD
jgi:hypothetical protein